MKSLGSETVPTGMRLIEPVRAKWRAGCYQTGLKPRSADGTDPRPHSALFAAAKGGVDQCRGSTLHLRYEVEDESTDEDSEPTDRGLGGQLVLA